MKPTREEISTADKLKRAGLCKNSKLMIMYNEGPLFLDAEKYSVQNREEMRSMWRLQGVPEGYEPMCYISTVGPLPDFKEIWEDLQIIIEGNEWHIELHSYILSITGAEYKNILDVDKYPLGIEYEDYGGIVGAVIEALLYLTERK